LQGRKYFWQITNPRKKGPGKNVKRRERNISARSRVKTSVKAALKSIEEKDVEKSRTVLFDTTKTIAKAAASGLFHKKTAARKISRLTKKVNSLG